MPFVLMLFKDWPAVRSTYTVHFTTALVGQESFEMCISQANSAPLCLSKPLLCVIYVRMRVFNLSYCSNLMWDVPGER